MFDADKWLALAAHYPDLIALLVGTLVGYVFTTMIELYFLPIYTDEKDQRRQKGLTFIFCWLVSGTCSAIIWVFIDPADPPLMRISISYIVSVLSFAGYPVIAKVATVLLKRVGIDLGSAWIKQ